ncbi:MAG: hypothetical protein ABI220_00745 [Candidatus Saccharimonadales bacterium]
MTKFIDREINVNAYYFAGREMKTFPKQIEYGNQAITFTNGLRFLIQQGSKATRLFDMSATDGSTYRLRQTGSSWRLLTTKGVQA